jgi:hypothetical protein
MSYSASVFAQPEHLTGVQITGSNFPDAGSFSDLGRGHINRPQVDVTLPRLIANFPVSPPPK